MAAAGQRHAAPRLPLHGGDHGARSRPQQRRRPQRPRQRMRLVLAVAVALLAAWPRPSAARVEIITDNPSPFAAVDPDAPKFIVNLFDSAAKAPAAAADAPPARWELMTASDGTRYNCSLPGARGAGREGTVGGRGSAGDAGSSGGSSGSSGGSGGGSSAASSSGGTPGTQLAKAQEPVPIQQGRTPFELLDPLTAICLYHKDATWTYEVCHRNRVRQFRQEGNGKTEEFSCGAYMGDEKQSEAIAEDTSASGRPVKYVVQRHNNGANCLLTGQPRTAEVRYTCLRGTKENMVVSVREFPTCNYVALVTTPLLCNHPEFKPPPEDLRMIDCMPLGGGSKKGKQEGGAAALGAAAGAGAVSEEAGKAAAGSSGVASPAEGAAAAASSGAAAAGGGAAAAKPAVARGGGGSGTAQAGSTEPSKKDEL